jgi:hypothetical protein
MGWANRCTRNFGLAIQNFNNRSSSNPHELHVFKPFHSISQFRDLRCTDSETREMVMRLDKVPVAWRLWKQMNGWKEFSITRRALPFCLTRMWGGRNNGYPNIVGSISRIYKRPVPDRLRGRGAKREGVMYRAVAKGYGERSGALEDWGFVGGMNWRWNKVDRLLNKRQSLVGVNHWFASRPLSLRVIGLHSRPAHKFQSSKENSS